jgi:hypothetical protein
VDRARRCSRRGPLDEGAPDWAGRLHGDGHEHFEQRAPRRGAIVAARLLAGSRIIRLGLLPRARYWTSVRAVELRCESTWRLLSGRSLSGRLLAGQFFADDRLSGQYPASDDTVAADGVTRSPVAGSSRSGSSAARAYSSIGQSPRLITGLFLVRTQVGPLALFHRSAPFHVSSSAPFRSTMVRSTMVRSSMFPGAVPSSTVFPRTTFRSRRRINTLRIENAMRRPTSL